VGNVFGGRVEAGVLIGNVEGGEVQSRFQMDGAQTTNQKGG
jgi:hypothetical protein